MRGRSGPSMAYQGSVEIRVRPKTFVGVRGERRHVEFDSVRDLRRRQPQRGVEPDGDR